MKKFAVGLVSFVAIATILAAIAVSTLRARAREMKAGFESPATRDAFSRALTGVVK
ncbi:MAG: hypothetical protein HYT82_00235 [Candidatus Harrisonbacteria bacterium]|nr:hypothetical protein [Candidatus Harrisonbacteria bacterium]